MQKQPSLSPIKSIGQNNNMEQTNPFVVEIPWLKNVKQPIAKKALKKVDKSKANKLVPE